eukprot:TRINITY_DN29715_c0_g1_i1.p1 TRINITY_DN29715_c0_g1~~TRINITY_DN29715_c0_g1_i1.p1  ORF type:complete len:892 (+),score=146.80 TRINITY_DN29715_c0_g1_i1:75-2678(+)
MAAHMLLSSASQKAQEDMHLLRRDMEQEQGESQVLKHRKAPIKGWVSKVLLRDSSPSFARDAEHALRGAFMLTVVGLPVILPKGAIESLDWFRGMGFYNSSVCTFIVYNLGRTFGEAFDKVKSGVKGIIICALCTWLLFTMFPEGVTEHSPPHVFWIGIAFGTLYASLILWARVSISLQIFALANFAPNWMMFVTPGHDEVLPPWHSNWAVSKDLPSQAMVTMCMGFCFVMLANLLPYPQWSLDIVQSRQEELLHESTRIFKLIVDHYASEEPNPYAQDQVIRNIRHLHVASSKVNHLIQVSWYESFGLGKSAVRRQILDSLDSVFAQIYNLLYNAWTLTQAEVVSKEDVAIIREVRNNIGQCLVTLEGILRLCIRAAEDGELKDYESLAVEESLERLRGDSKILGELFASVRHKVSAGDAKLIFKDLRVSHVLLWTFGNIADEVEHFAKRLVELKRDQASLPAVLELGSCASAFHGLLDPDHVSFAVRGIMAYVTCFVVGYFGFRDVVPEGTAAAASTAALFLSNFVGSNVVKQLQRIQGLMIGQVMVLILRRLTAGCDWEDIAVHAFIVFAYALFTLFVCYHSDRFATVGCLAAGFGTATLLNIPCDADQTHKRAVFYTLSSTCLAILVTAFYDLLFSRDRASDRAHEALHKCWDTLAASLEELFDMNVSEAASCTAKAEAYLATAEKMNAEADLEPRWWRVEWRTELFSSVLRETEKMIVALHSIHASMMSRNSGKQETIRGVFVRRCKHADGHGQSLAYTRFKTVQKLLQFFVHETAHRFPVLADETVLQEFHKQEDRLQEVFLRDEVHGLVANLQGLEQTAKQKLSEDELANLLTAVAGIDRIGLVLNKVRHAILKNAWQAA